MKRKGLSLLGVIIVVLLSLSDGVLYDFDGWLSVLVHVAELALLAVSLRFLSRALSE